MYVSEICAEGMLVSFPWWLKNVKSRSKIALKKKNERHFEIWFPKMKTFTFFRRKLSKLYKKDTFLHVTNYIFPKIKTNKNKQWTHFGALVPSIFNQSYSTQRQFCWLPVCNGHGICVKSLFAENGENYRTVYIKSSLLNKNKKGSRH